MTGPSVNWSTFRRQMPIAGRWAYFDHAAVAPLSEPARTVLAAWADDVASNGDVYWPRWAAQVERTRRLAAELLGASDQEIALVRNTTEGINFVAEGLPWRDGDNIVTLADEFPSNQYPWMNLADRGVETRRLSQERGHLSPREIAAACDARTRLVSVSWVGYADGWRQDLDELATLVHARGAYLFVDAIQGLGVFPLDVRRTPVDFLAADGHKWLLGPEGAGIFYVRSELLEVLRPLGVGWNSVRSGDFARIALDLKPSAARYEGGTANTGGQLALGASLEVLAAFGTTRLGQRVLEVADECAARLAKIGAQVVGRGTGERRSGIIGFELPGVEPLHARKICLEQGIVVSCRAGRLRISPHAYNDSQDIDRLVRACQAALSAGNG